MVISPTWRASSASWVGRTMRMARSDSRRSRSSMLLDRAAMGIEADGDFADMAGQQRVLGGTHHADGEVGFAPQQIIHAVGQRQFQRDLGIGRLETPQHRRQHGAADHLRRADPDRAAHGFHFPRSLTQQRLGGRLHRFGMGFQREGQRCRRQTALRPGEKRRAETGLQRFDMPAQGRLGQAQRARRARQAAPAQHGEEGAVECPVVHKIMYSRSRLFINFHLPPSAAFSPHRVSQMRRSIMDNKQKSILVIGASGGVGGAVAANMARRGWRVIGLSRIERPAQKGIEWRVGDAMSQEDLVRAAKGVDVVFYGANPPKYKNWDKVCLPMVKNAIAAAEAAGARLAFPGTVYNFDIDATGELVAEDAPQHPKTRKGAIRVAMEAELEAFAKRGGRVLIVRAGDYFGSNVANSWFQGALIKPGQEVGSI